MCEGSKPRTFQACTGASGCNYTLVNECAAHTDNCATHASCMDTYSSFECSCKPGSPSLPRLSRSDADARGSGYVGSGTVCEDEDECVTQTGVCDAGRTCVNTEGSFECLCKEGEEERGSRRHRSDVLVRGRRLLPGHGVALGLLRRLSRGPLHLRARADVLQLVRARLLRDRRQQLQGVSSRVVVSGEKPAGDGLPVRVR